MTEQEWFDCFDPEPMLEFLHQKPSDRKRRLFASACCRRLSDYFKDERSLRMVEISEHYADGIVSEDVLEATFDEAADAQEAVHWEGGDAVDQSAAEAVLGLRLGLDMRQVFAGAAESAGSVEVAKQYDRIYGTPGRPWQETEQESQEAEDAGMRRESDSQAKLIHDIFGNPFRPVTLDPTWLTTTVVEIADGIYADLAFGRLPILADALEEAGCDNADILNHCRGDGSHVRGCWVVDLVLGKG